MQFIAIIQSTRPELESKISAMRILDHNPQKPVVRMANLCVVSAHTVKCPFFRSLYSCYLLLYLIQNVSHILIKFTRYKIANILLPVSLQVNGVAQLHSDILKSELFADYVSVWPTKFQNKTNGITPRRWLRFCSPELSQIITKWLKTDQWVTNLDLLADLRQVCYITKLQTNDYLFLSYCFLSLLTLLTLLYTQVC